MEQQDYSLQTPQYKPLSEQGESPGHQLMPPFNVLKHKLKNFGDSQIPKTEQRWEACWVLMVQLISSLQVLQTVG